jgi:hypothetical protein
MARTAWTDERLAQLRRLMNLSLSYKEIGEALGCTPNAARTTAYKYGWTGHGRSALIRSERLKGQKRPDGFGAKISEHSRRRWQDPECRERMLAGIRSAAAAAVRREKISEAYAQRRGFRVPAHLQADYRFLVDVKKYRPREAGEMLGLRPEARRAAA